MKRLLLLTIISLLVGGMVYGQEIFTCPNAHLSFFSSAPVEDITAQTDSGVSVINLKTGTVYFKVSVRSFQFERALMQEHFNKHYLQSDIYPFAEFKGKILDFARSDSEGVFPVTVQGQLTIHGITRTYKVQGSLELKAGEMAANSVFEVHLADHNIKIPRLLIRNIAETVEIKVNAIYDVQEEAISIP